MDKKIKRLMTRRENQLRSGRGTGSGPEYVPLLKANEAKANSTAYMIKDPIAGRFVHTMSSVEKDFFYTLRWDREIEEIREQYVMDMDKVRMITDRYNLGPVNRRLPYTLDFLVTYKDKTKKPTAYSVKRAASVFNPDSLEYQGCRDKYEKLMRRQSIEKIYWETEDCDFSIVVSEDINHVLSNNVELVLGFYDRSKAVNTAQKLLYLIAHRYIEVPMDKERLMPNRMIKTLPYDIDMLFDQAAAEEEETWKMNRQ